MKTINIYLTKKEKTKAHEVCWKYRVCLSTLTGIVAFTTYKLLFKYNEQKLVIIQNQYIEKEKPCKTSIKPRELVEEYLSQVIKNKNLFATNCLKIYLNKLITNYLDKDQVKQYYAEIDKTLKERYDLMWNYNATLRKTARLMSENPEYWKKVMESRVRK